MADYTTQMLDNLPGWWVKDINSNNYKFVSSFETSFDTVENEILEFKHGWQINYATGIDLDKIAEKYSLVRNKNDTDESFRAKIKSYLLIFSGSGTDDDIKDILSFYTGLETTDITITQIREMVFSIIIAVDSDTDETILNDVVNIVPDIKAAGTYVLEIDYASKNNIFLTNLSETNGADKLN